MGRNLYAPVPEDLPKRLFVCRLLTVSEQADNQDDREDQEQLEVAHVMTPTAIRGGGTQGSRSL